MKVQTTMEKIKKHVRKYSDTRTVILGAAVLLAVPLAVLTLPVLTKTDYDVKGSALGGVAEIVEADSRLMITHVPIPDAVRAIYMTSCVAGTPSFRTDVVSLIESTELNSVIIDIKDYSGSISFPTQNPLLVGAWEHAACGARDMKEFVAELHEKGIYVIGRITVFQDPYYSNKRPDLAVKRESDGEVWRDYKGLSFIDVGATEYWNYIIEISKESYNLGFDELNFDYIRFPSDGNMKDIAYEHSGGGKAQQLELFFAHLSKALRNPALFEEFQHEGISKGSASPILSADLFGMTTTNTDDLNIGQVVERTFPYFDYIAPMVYPSHYPAGFNGWQNPNNYPYEVVHFSMQSAVKRAIATTTTVVTLSGELLSTSTVPFTYSKDYYSPLVFRPWLQDFDYGGDYDVAEVKAQIQAAYDAGLNSWMLWSPSNRYTRGALAPAL